MKKVLFVMAAAAALLSGCGLFTPRQAWKHAQQKPPLEIPSSLDRPDVSDALTIPRVNDQPTVAAPATTSDLHVAAAPAAAWVHIGKALRDANLGSVTSPGADSLRYTVHVGDGFSYKKKGLMSRLFGRDKPHESLDAPELGRPVTVTVKPAAAGGSTLVVGGDAAPVRRVVAALKSRLGG